MTSIRTWILGALLSLAAAAPALAAEAAATVVMLTGQATAVGSDGAVRTLSRDDALFSGDLINSGPGSYLNMKFTDGGFFLLRPNTRFQIEDYRYVDPAQVEAAKAKAAADAAAAQAAAAAAAAAPPATLRGPSREEVAQACAASQVCRDCRASKNDKSKACNLCFARVQNCKAVKKAFAAAQAKTPTQTAAQPAAPATAPTPTPAPAIPAAPIVTAAVAEGSDSSRAFFRLVKGGFRSVSGLIGKVNQDDYRVSTPVATIGIRGTRYGVRLCQGECPDREEILTKLRAAGRDAKPGETVLITTVEEGKIAIQTKTAQDLQVPGSTRLVNADGDIASSDTPPSTEQNDQDLNPEACVPAG